MSFESTAHAGVQRPNFRRLTSQQNCVSQMFQSFDKELQSIADKVAAGERLSFDDGVFLDESADLHAIGHLANIVRERKNGNAAYYNTNIHLNPTNVCVYRCRFCAFRADLKDDKAYTFDEPMIRERVLEGQAAGATEISSPRAIESMAGARGTGRDASRHQFARLASD